MLQIKRTKLVSGEGDLEQLATAFGETDDPRLWRLNRPSGSDHVIEQGATKAAAEVRAPLAPVEAFAAQRAPTRRKLRSVNPEPRHKFLTWRG